MVYYTISGNFVVTTYLTSTFNSVPSAGC